MIDAGRLAQVIHGIRLILRLEPGGLSFFEKSYPGFIRSFFPAVVLAPLQFLESYLQYGGFKVKPDALSYAVIEALFYIVSWTLFPYAMIYIAALLGRSERYFSYIVAYNWLAALPFTIVLLLNILTLSNIMSPSAAGFFWLTLMGASVLYYTFLARMALLLPVMTALGIVVLDIVIGLSSALVIQRMEQPPPAEVSQDQSSMQTIEVTAKRR